MAGTMIMIVILLLAPVGILMSSTIFVGVLSALLNRDVDASHEGSELLEVAQSGMSISSD